MARYDLTNFEWRVIEPLLTMKPRGVPRVDDRRVLNGIFWILRSGTPWRDLPERYGPYSTIYKPMAEWLLADLPKGAHLRADRGYDADWIRELIDDQDCTSHIPPRRNRYETAMAQAL